MKSSAAYIIALARLSTASPLPQFSLPSLGGGGGGLPSLGGSGDGFPSLGGGGGGLPSLGGGGGLPSLGGGGFGLPSFPEPSGGLGGLSIPSFPGLTAVATADNSGTSPTSVQVSTTGGSHPVATSAPGSGTIGSGCRPQNGGGLGSENGVTDKNCCTDLTVIFARGTGELGNVGTVTGPPMFKALRSKLGANNVTIQGVDYPASAGGNANLGMDGGPKMAALIKTALAQCPSSKIVVSGYSQGAMVVHNALGKASSQVAGAVLFGDPLISQSVGSLPAAKVKEFCASADTVCLKPTGDVTGSHLSYGSVADAAAGAVLKFAGLL